MRRGWMLAALAGLSTGPAFGQGLIAPSRTYNSGPAATYATPPSTLEKGYGLPTFGNPQMPEQKSQAPKPQAAPARPDAFQPLRGFASPDAPSSETPDFFSKAPDADSDTPDFFGSSGDPGFRKADAAHPGMDTPVYTTQEGMETGDARAATSFGSSAATGTDDTTFGSKAPMETDDDTLSRTRDGAGTR